MLPRSLTIYTAYTGLQYQTHYSVRSRKGGCEVEILARKRASFQTAAYPAAHIFTARKQYRHDVLGLVSFGLGNQRVHIYQCHDG